MRPFVLAAAAVAAVAFGFGAGCGGGSSSGTKPKITGPGAGGRSGPPATSSGPAPFPTAPGPSGGGATGLAPGAPGGGAGASGPTVSVGAGVGVGVGAGGSGSGGAGGASAAGGSAAGTGAGSGTTATAGTGAGSGATTGSAAGSGATGGSGVAAPPPGVYFLEDFDGSPWGGFVFPSGRLWESGTPRHGPSSAASGQRCLATDKRHNYPDQVHELCWTRHIDLRGAQKPVLTFRHWYATEDMYDGGQVFAFAGTAAHLLHPGRGYPRPWVEGLGGTPGFTGADTTWSDAWFDLSFLAGKDQVRIVFGFGSDGSRNADGWFIDDVLVAEAPVVEARLGTQRLGAAGAATTLLFAEDFEGPAPQLSRSLGGGSQWEFGAPVSKFLSWVPQGARIGATRLDRPYDGDVRRDRLLTPFVDFSGASGAILKFSHHYYTEHGYDGGRVLASADGVSFVAIDPLGGYPVRSVDKLHGAGYSGFNPGWANAAFDLTPLLATLGPRFQIAFEFASDDWKNFDGWALDEIQILRR